MVAEPEAGEILEAGLPLALLAPAPTTARRIWRVRGSSASAVAVDGDVITEIRFSILLADRELVTLMCSPWKLRELVLGFLFVEGIIDALDDLELLRVCLEDRLAEVRLRRSDFRIPERKILTSGCTGGQTFGLYLESLESYRVVGGPRVEPTEIYALMQALYGAAQLYHRARGVHTAVLGEGGRALVVAEDIGRHNTIDKIAGECLVRGETAAGRVILTTGRISSEMLLKSAILGVPIVGSRTSPTALALTLAERLNITVLGYIRPDSLNVYTHPWRLAGLTD